MTLLTQPPPTAGLASTIYPRALGMILQLSRASTIALARLQLAIRSNDRRQALAAMDRIHALDTEMERLLSHLPAPGGDDPEWQAMMRHLGDQKLALDFEKLALASGVSGPDMITRTDASSFSEDTKPQAASDTDDDAGRGTTSVIHLEPVEWTAPSPRFIGLALTLLVMAAVIWGVTILGAI